MTPGLQRTLILKEGRALAPIWLAAAATVVAGARTGEFAVAVFAFVLGAVALGVYSIGHEYAHRTLTSLLAQPLSRSQLLLAKISVLATFVALLTLVAARSLLPVEAFEPWRGNPAAARWWLWMLFLTPALALCIAPWLTMISRSVMGGLVFTLAVPAGFWIAGQIARVATMGFTADELAYGPALTLMIVGLLTVSGVAAVHGRAMFIGLEAIDAPREIASTRRTSARPSTAVRSRRRHPLVMLVHKEVRLHGLAGVVASLFALVWISMRLTRMDAYIAGQSFATMTALYGVFIAMMLGSSGAAEERALGTAEWQILQPYAFWKQWLTKVLTIGILALLLGLVLPGLLERAFPLISGSGSIGPKVLLPYLPYSMTRGVQIILVVALLSSYASSLCVGALRALMLTVTFTLTLAALFNNLASTAYRVERSLFERWYGPAPRSGWWWQGLPTANWGDVITAYRVGWWIATLAITAFLVTIFVLAFRNSRSAERGLSIARKQVPWVLVSALAGAIVINGGPKLVEWWLLTH